MTIQRLMGALMAATGLVLVAGPLLRWPWFVAGARFRRLERALGPKGAEAIYGAVGVALVVFGMLNVIGAWRRG